MIHFGHVPASSTLYIPFATYDANGASVTMTGLAVTDIEIYKNGSTTQRASDNGYTLLDTDGIDFDGITGLHGFSVDLSDNSDAGFYAVGSQYWVVVSTVTVSAQTVTVIAATFRIVSAEGVTGQPKVDTSAWNGTAVASPATAGYPAVTIKSGTGTGEVSLSSGTVTVGTNNDKTGYAVTSSEHTNIADALLKRDMSAVSGESARSPLNALRFIRNKWTASGGTLTVYKEDDTTSAWTSALTDSAGANPITASDPA